jgi:DNA-binding response OmpR family regulator
LDWKLADLSGLAVTRMIRSDSNEQVSNLPIVLLGSEMSENDRIRGLETGADLCLNSTSPPAIFISHLRSLLRRVGTQQK